MDGEATRVRVEAGADAMRLSGDWTLRALAPVIASVRFAQGRVRDARLRQRRRYVGMSIDSSRESSITSSNAKSSCATGAACEAWLACACEE